MIAPARPAKFHYMPDAPPRRYSVCQPVAATPGIPMPPERLTTEGDAMVAPGFAATSKACAPAWGNSRSQGSCWQERHVYQFFTRAKVPCSPTSRGVGKAIFRLAWVVHDFVVYFEFIPRVIAAAYLLREAGERAEKFNMRYIVKVNPGAEPPGIQKVGSRRFVGRKENIVAPRAQDLG